MSSSQDIDNKEKQEKEKVLENSNVLLISDNEEDYDELIKYGFKNVTWFPSIIRADNYFAEHPEMLDKFHIVIEGEHEVLNCLKWGFVDLQHTIYWGEVTYKPFVHTKINHMHYSDGCVIDASVATSSGKEEIASGYSNIFDTIVSTAIKHKILKHRKSNEPFVIKDFVKEDRLPLPKKKEDLKILYLDSAFDDENRYLEYASAFTKKLGLNVTFLQDNRSALGRKDDDYTGVNWQLGDFDIIIGTRYYSKNLIYLGPESTEQCKDTGRDLTLLMVYDCSNYFNMNNGIDLDYCFGGRLAPDSGKYSSSFNRFYTSFDLPYDNDENVDWFNSKFSDMLSIIGSAVNLYNDALKHNQKSPITDLSDGDIPLKSIEDYTREYNEHNKEQERIRGEIDKIRSTVSTYLERRSRHSVGRLPSNLQIMKKDDSVKITKFNNDRPICSLIFSMDDDSKFATRVSVQTLTKKGKLSDYQELRISDSIPLPNQKQIGVINCIYNDVERSIKPLIDVPEQPERHKSRGQYQRYSRRPNNWS